MQSTTKLLLSKLQWYSAHRQIARYAAAFLQTPDVCAFPLGSLTYASCVFHSESEALFVAYARPVLAQEDAARSQCHPKKTESAQAALPQPAKRAT